MSMDLTNNTPSRFSSTIRAKRTRVNDSPGHKDIMKDIEGDLALLDRGTDVPPFMKNIVLHLINIVQEQATIISSISLENQSLSSDIIALKAKAAENAPVSVPVTTVCSDPCEERERSRAIVISGIYESQSSHAVERNEQDMCKVKQVINSLGVECQPVTTYRMGQMGSRPRLLKVVLPTSRHQRVLCERSHFLKNSQYRGVWLRQSLTSEERARQRAERQQNGAWRGPGFPPQGGQGPRAYGDPSHARIPSTGLRNGPAGSYNRVPGN